MLHKLLLLDLLILTNRPGRARWGLLPKQTLEKRAVVNVGDVLVGITPRWGRARPHGTGGLYTPQCRQRARPSCQS